MSAISIEDYDLQEAINLCYAANQQDAPQTCEFYLNQVLNILYGYLPPDGRQKLDLYLAEKQYIPPVTIELSK